MAIETIVSTGEGWIVSQFENLRAKKPKGGPKPPFTILWMSHLKEIY